MDRTKLLTAGVTIFAATATVSLMIWREARNTPDVPRVPVAVAAVQPVAPVPVPDRIALSEPDPVPANDAPVSLPPAPARPVAALPPEAVSGPDLPETAPLPVSAPAAALPELPVDLAERPGLAPADTGLPDRIALLGVNDLSPDSSERGVRRNSHGVPCGITLSSIAKPAAMAKLTVTAPCRPNASITIRHGDLVFSQVTNALGSFKTDVPALFSPAEFSVEFQDGARAETVVNLDDLETYTRVALQWQGFAGLHIHALEFGADYGEPGHVWSGAPRGPEFAASGRGGFVARLGNEGGLAPRTAEVYTFPAGLSEEDGVVRLSIEAEVAPMNCGREISGQTIQPEDAGAPPAVALSLAMPSCDAMGEYLVLKNVLRDLRIAAR
jgi:hypothetical protein